MKTLLQKYLPYILILTFILLLQGCASQPEPSSYNAPGFFIGWWHGFIAPWSFIGSIFTDIRIYEFPNSGFWYDFGFILGVGVLGGGAAASK